MCNRDIAMDDDCKEYRRNKPQQQLYKPGSGPLRRSSYGLDAKMDSYAVDKTRGRDRSHYGSHQSVNDVDTTTPYREQMGQSARQRKPEQQLYVPKSGDTSTDIDRSSKTSSRCDNSSQYNNRRMSNKQDKHGFNSGTGSYSRGASRREFHYKDGANNDINYNRHYRQVSESRSISPTQCAQEQTKADRNRDSRSMEVSAGRNMAQSSGGKPPSGRRNSAGYPTDSGRPKYMVNLDNIPPRFRKKFLEQSSHHSSDSVDQINRDRYQSNHSVQPNYNQSQFFNNCNSNWSQTLPSRGRGRLRDHESFDREKFINAYLKNYEVQNSRRSTPSSSYMNLYDPNALDNRNINETTDGYTSSIGSQKEYDGKLHSVLNSNILNSLPFLFMFFIY